MHRTLSILLFMWAAPVAAAGVEWSGAVRVGGGATVQGKGGVELALRLDTLIGKGDGSHDLEGGWAAGPFLDLRSLDFTRGDFTAGLSLATPASAKADFLGVLQLGGGYGVGYHPHPDVPELVVSLFGGWRVPAGGHQAAAFGFYLDTRVLFGPGRAVEITGGVVIDPVGAVKLLMGRAMAF